MATGFGQNHRQLVRDTNEGLVQPVAVERGKTARQNIGVRSVQNIGTPDDFSTAKALVETAGVVGQKYQAEADRKAAIRGYNLAGTEEGRKAVDEASSTLSTKLFGPNAEIRAAQGRIVNDSVDNAYLQLQQELNEWGKTKTPDEWNKHVEDTLGGILDKYDDEGIKDQIVQHFSKNGQALARDYTKSNELYRQTENRQTVMNSMTKAGQVAHLDLTSGDPHRQQDAKDRLSASLAIPEGMSKEAHEAAVTTVLMDELGKGRAGLYESAKEQGFLDTMTVENRRSLESAQRIYEYNNSRDALEQFNQLEDTIKRGDVEGARALATKLQQAYPEAVESINAETKKAQTQKAALEEQQRTLAEQAAKDAQAARDKQLEEQGGRAYRESLAMAGHVDLGYATIQQQQTAMNDMLYSIAERGVKQEMQAQAIKNGEEWDENAPISPQALNQWLARNPQVYASKWGKNRIVTNAVRQQTRDVVSELRRTDLTDQNVASIRDGMQQLSVLQAENPVLFAKHFDSPEDLRLFSEYNQRINVEKQDAQTAIQLIRERERTVATGQSFPANEHQLARGANGVVDSYIKANGNEEGWLWWKKNIPPENASILEGQAKAIYAEEFELARGNVAVAQASAVARLQAGSIMVGNQYVPNGAELESNSINGNLDRYIQGLNDDQTFRDDMVLNENFPQDFDLRADSVTIIPHAGGQSFTIMMPGSNGGMAVKDFNIPTEEGDILPTRPQQYLNSATNFFKNRMEEAKNMGSRVVEWEAQ